MEIKNYREFLALIKEGLIKTHNILYHQLSLKTVLDKYGFDYDLNVESKFIFTLKFLNTDKLHQIQIDAILPLVNNYGYFPSYIKVELLNGMVNGFIFDEKYLSNKYKSFEITFESKYEDGAYKNDVDVPGKAYHLTREKYKDNIFKKGLYPKRQNRKSNHLERVYLFYDVINYKSLLKTLKVSDYVNGVFDEKYMLLEVKLNDGYIIHGDPNYNDGFYTTENIPPSEIKLLKENL